MPGVHLMMAGVHFTVLIYSIRNSSMSNLNRLTNSSTDNNVYLVTDSGGCKLFFPSRISAITVSFSSDSGFIISVLHVTDIFVSGCRLQFASDTRSTY